MQIFQADDAALSVLHLNPILREGQIERAPGMFVADHIARIRQSLADGFGQAWSTTDQLFGRPVTPFDDAPFIGYDERRVDFLKQQFIITETGFFFLHFFFLFLK